ncbi:putative amp-binding enzyme family protein [Botrytis fragariae]|uniref:Putative amp-binding enzyme family protein n=1 Tax=Botrytis fragariae TaxID=1964551 RepID=A0A8H6ED30_9HELO|nr:putative amp-binding enzyme family protein [Botrytis fragariae]KAF5867887.1 putative amp-binding enzyme family protein [Botrytis fragariae]
MDTSTISDEFPVGKLKAECLGLEIPGINQSLWDMFAAAAEKHMNEEALCSLWQPSGHLSPRLEIEQTDLETHIIPITNEDGVGMVTPKSCSAPLRWTFGQLRKKAESLAIWLQQRGCTKGDNLVVFVWNSAEWALFLWVAARLRMPFVPLDPRSSDKDVMHYLSLAPPQVLVVLDPDASPVFESLGNVKVRISLSKVSEGTRNWHSLPGIMGNLPMENISFAPSEDDCTELGQELATILFTSGTTSVPKGCPHTASNIWSATYDYDPVARKNGCQNRWLIHTPVWHIFAMGQTIRGWRDGSSVVFATEKFDVTASLRALQHENITHVGAVPLLVKALVAHPEFPGKNSLSLSYVTMGGTLIKDEDVRFCKEHLGSEAVIQGFGMTEGSPMVSWRRDDPMLKNGYHLGVGKVLPGARLKICSPKSHVPLNKSETGELHIGGTSVIDGYLNGIDLGSFYTDDVGKWFVTGDQAMIDRGDVLYISGRYKDIIIRGGENLVPSKIEYCLQDLGITAQVIGIVDSIAGEVPVAVLQSYPKEVSKAQMTKAIVENLGQTYALYSIITLDDLHLKAFPMTATGKIRKVELKGIVNRYFATISEAKRTNPSEKLVAQLREIWAELMNAAPDDISVEDDVTDFADSITRLRFCKILWTRLGQRLYLPDLEKNNTIKQQTKLLVERSYHRDSPTSLSDNVTSSEGQSNLTASAESRPKVPHLQGGTMRQYHHTVAEAANEALQKFGLTLENDMEDVLAIKDTFQEFAKGQRPQSYRHRIAFEIKDRNSSQVRAALEKSLLTRPVLRTVLVEVSGAAAVHAVLRPSQAVHDMLISHRNLSHESEIQEYLIDDSDQNFEDRMFQAVIADVEGKDTSVLILTLNHSVFDALFAYGWYSDLDMFIQNPRATATPGTPFRLFADMYQQYQDSSLALSDVNFHVRRLRGISRFTEALWPPKRAPGWMVGNDRKSKDFITRNTKRRKLNINSQPRPRLARMQDFPDIERLRTQHLIQAPVIVKTAISIFNVIQTGKPHAIFKNFDAGRNWPFLPEWIADRLPSAMSIDGPTLTWNMNMIQIKPKETCGELLRRMNEDDKALSSHTHAPWFKILSGLGEDEGPIAKEAAMRQAFNWDLSLKYLDSSVGDYSTLKPLGRMDWPDCGFFWNCGMANMERFCCVVSWDDTQLDINEINGHVSKLLEIIGWITNPKNWNNSVSSFQGFPMMT